MAKQGDWFSHTGEEWQGRMCVKQKNGTWAVIREARALGGPAKGFCALAHGDEPARGTVTVVTKIDALIEKYEARAKLESGRYVRAEDVVKELKALK